MFGHQDEDQDKTIPAQSNSASDDQADQSNLSATDVAIGDDGSDYVDHSTPPEPLDHDHPEAGAESDVTPNDRPRDDDSVGANSDLLDIKKQALEELSPLVNHLDQSPEEKFKTTMMMIQANDNQSLIPDAYHAAKSISDEKVRAQALLDIVNEINYFTHKS